MENARFTMIRGGNASPLLTPTYVTSCKSALCKTLSQEFPVKDGIKQSMIVEVMDGYTGSESGAFPRVVSG